MIGEVQLGPGSPTGGALMNEGRGAPSTPGQAAPSPQTSLR